MAAPSLLHCVKYLSSYLETTLARERDIEKGREKGREKAREKGREKRREKGREKRREKGREKGREGRGAKCTIHHGGSEGI